MSERTWKPTPPPGVYEGVPKDDYLAWDAASNSALAALDKSPAHLAARKRNPPPSTPAQDDGTALHALVLEPDVFAATYAISSQCEAITGRGGQCSKGGQVCRDGKWFCSTKGHDPEAGEPSEREALSAALWDNLHQARDVVVADPEAGPILEGLTHREISIVWDMEGVRMKARLDGFGPNVFELKKTRDASVGGFYRDATRYGYWRQAWLYREAALAHPGELLAPDTALLCAVELGDPVVVQMYEWTDAALEAGALDARRLLAEYAECSRANIWPLRSRHYPGGIQPLTLTDFAWNEIVGAQDEAREEALV